MHSLRSAALGSLLGVFFVAGTVACSSDDSDGEPVSPDASAATGADAGTADSSVEASGDGQAPGLRVGDQDGGDDVVTTSSDMLSAAIGDGGVVMFGSRLFTEANDGTVRDTVTGSYGGMTIGFAFADPPAPGIYACGEDGGVVTTMSYGASVSGELPTSFVAPQADAGASAAGCTITFAPGSNGDVINGTFSGRLYSADGGDHVDVTQGAFSLRVTVSLSP